MYPCSLTGTGFLAPWAVYCGCTGILESDRSTLAPQKESPKPFEPERVADVVEYAKLDGPAELKLSEDRLPPAPGPKAGPGAASGANRLVAVLSLHQLRLFVHLFSNHASK
jgi:hypothetical protein